MPNFIAVLSLPIAYSNPFEATSTGHSSWNVVPGGDKENARLVVSGIVVDAAEELKG